MASSVSGEDEPNSAPHGVSLACFGHLNLSEQGLLQENSKLPYLCSCKHRTNPSVQSKLYGQNQGGVCWISSLISWFSVIWNL